MYANEARGLCDLVAVHGDVLDASGSVRVLLGSCSHLHVVAKCAYSVKVTRRYARFRPTFRQTLQASEAALKAMSPDGKLPEAMQRGFDAMMPPAPKKRLQRLDAPHKEPLERDIQRAIIEALRIHPRVIKVCRFNSGGSLNRNAAGREYLVMFSSEPVPDLFFLLRDPPGFGWYEIKRPSFKKPRDLREERQAAFLAAVREAGGIGEFIRSIDEAMEAIK